MGSRQRLLKRRRREGAPGSTKTQGQVRLEEYDLEHEEEQDGQARAGRYGDHPG
jgi:hypothetical protein